MRHYMKLDPKPFNMIKNGEKRIELRLNDEKRCIIKIGDEIEFTNTDNNSLKLLTKVIEIHKFSSFDELYKNLPLMKCGYTADDIKTAKPEDMDCYYSKEKQNKYGVVGIEIETLK